jgi:hypothetical protein
MERRPVARLRLGHAARSVTRRHYVGNDLARLQEAVEKIVLDVSTGQILTLPLAVAGRGAPEADHRYKRTADLTAGLTAGRRKRGSRRTPNLLKLIGIGGVAEWSKAPVLKSHFGITNKVSKWTLRTPREQTLISVCSRLGTNLLGFGEDAGMRQNATRRDPKRQKLCEWRVNGGRGISGSATL